MRCTIVPAFVDTNIWVYALTTTDPAKSLVAKACVGALNTPVISGQVLEGRLKLENPFLALGSG